MVSVGYRLAVVERVFSHHPQESNTQGYRGYSKVGSHTACRVVLGQ